jgi:hypothetical protein
MGPQPRQFKMMDGLLNDGFFHCSFLTFIRVTRTNKNSEQNSIYQLATLNNQPRQI